MSPGDRIDWERVIMDIQRATGLADMSDRASLAEIASACGRTFTWAWNLKNIPGTQPKLHDGLILLGLWAEVMGQDKPALPQALPVLP